MAPQKGQKPKKENVAPVKEKLELKTVEVEAQVSNRAVWEKAFEGAIQRLNELQPIKEVIENGGKKAIGVDVKGDRVCSRCQTQSSDLIIHVEIVYGYNTRSGKGEIRIVKENKYWCGKCKIEARVKTSKPIIDQDSAKRAADYVFDNVKKSFYKPGGSKGQKTLSDPILWEFYYGKIN